MRLLQRTNRAYLLFTAVLLLIIGASLYAIITEVIDSEVTEKLEVDRQRIIRALGSGTPVQDLPPVIEVIALPAGAAEEAMHVDDVVLLDPEEDDEEPFREVSGTERINGTLFRITTRAVVLEPHDYLYSIGLALLIGSLLLLSGLWWMNRRMARTVWGAFHRNLSTLQHFDVRNDAALALEPSAITEFNELNEELTRLTERIRNDHRVLKEFTGNAAHEMQTPLAAMQARLEVVLAAPALDAATAAGVHEAHAQCLRLARLHQGLLLLSRIENHQFRGTRALNVAEAVDAELDRYAERVAALSLIVDRTLDRSCTVQAHPELLEALLSNVIGNAFKHHGAGTPIRIVLRARTLEVSNAAAPLAAPAEEFFQRFRKADPASTSPGLGLSIARSICEACGWGIYYHEYDGLHALTIRF